MAVRYRKYHQQCRDIPCRGIQRKQYCPDDIPKKENGEYKTCGVWCVEFFDDNKRWQSLTFKDIRCKGEAEKRLSLFISDRERGQLNLPKLRKIPTLREYSVKYLALCKQSRENTYSVKQRAVNILSEHLGDFRLDKLNEVVVIKFIMQRDEKGTKPGTINEDIGKLKQILGVACREGIIDSIPCKDIKKLKVTQSRDSVLTSEDIAFILEGGELKPKDRLVILVSLFTGMRLTEVLSLWWDNIDFSKSLVSIVQGKTGKAVTIPLSSYLAGELQSYKASCQGEGVFENRPITQKLTMFYSSYFSKLFKRHDIQNFTFHNLRHTFASLQGDLGTGAITTKELLGHSDLSMTMRYTHTGLDIKRRAIESLTEHILGIDKEKVLSIKA